MRTLILLVGLLSTTAALAQQPNQQALQVHKDNLARLSRLDGNWRGTATIMTPDGSQLKLTQTERVGPLLNGTVKIIEGRGYDSDGTTQFNALGIISYDPQQAQLSMRSYAQGRSGDFTITLTDNGFSWEIQAGQATIRYVATITETTWQEVGQRIVAGQEPITFIEMNLKKIDDSDWPAGVPVPWK